MTGGYEIEVGAVAVSFGPERRYRHKDFRGNVAFVSDESGAVVSHQSYAPYGVEAVFGEGGGVSFAGRPELGDLMLLGARAYDPLVDRFLSPDPVFQTLNQYAYTLGNPVWFWDPDGAQATLEELEQAHADAVADLNVSIKVFGAALGAAVHGAAKSRGDPFTVGIMSVVLVSAAQQVLQHLVRVRRTAKALEEARNGAAAGGEGRLGLPDTVSPSDPIRQMQPSRRPPRAQDAIPGAFSSPSASVPACGLVG